MAACDSCGASSSAALQLCARCHIVSYCGKACQTKHWKDGGHKERCRNSEQAIQAVALATDNGASANEIGRLLTGYSTILMDKVNRMFVVFLA